MATIVSGDGQENISPGDFAMHNESKSIYKVLTVLGETFVDVTGKIHQTKEYSKLTIGGDF